LLSITESESEISYAYKKKHVERAACGVKVVINKGQEELMEMLNGKFW